MAKTIQRKPQEICSKAGQARQVILWLGCTHSERPRCPPNHLFTAFCFPPESVSFEELLFFNSSSTLAATLLEMGGGNPKIVDEHFVGIRRSLSKTNTHRRAHAHTHTQRHGQVVTLGSYTARRSGFQSGAGLACTCWSYASVLATKGRLERSRNLPRPTSWPQ